MEQDKYPGGRGKIKREQGAQKSEKKEQGKSQKGTRGKKFKGAESRDPPNRGSFSMLLYFSLGLASYLNMYHRAQMGQGSS